MNDIVASPFASQQAAAPQQTGAMVSVEQQRAIAEVQARMIIARSNPRNAVRCMDAILEDCMRPSMAEIAVYQYGRGGNDVSGASIKLAEAVARRWGNIASGIKEVSRSNGYSECIAYAWDLESGYYDERQFQVRHWRDTKQGGYPIKDERDIYELVANMGQRRKRAVLLTVIPADVMDAAVHQCELTLKAKADVTPEGITKMVEAFDALGVSKEQIEKRIQRRIDSIQPAQVVNLKKIYASIRDGMSEPKDWFEVDGAVSDSGGEQAKKPGYPQDAFDKNLPSWKKLIKDNKKTPDQIIAMAQSKGELSAEQIAAIRAPVEEAKAEKKGDAEELAAPAALKALLEKAKAASITDADIAKKLGVKSLDGITVAQLEAAVAFVNNPTGN